MNLMTVTLYQKTIKILPELAHVAHGMHSHGQLATAADYRKAIETLNDMREYCMLNMGKTVASDRGLSLVHNEVSVRRLRHVVQTMKQMSEQYPRPEIIRKKPDYEEAVQTIATYVKHFKAQK